MSFHHNLLQWQALCLPENCGVCQNLPPTEPDYTTIREFETSWLEAQPRVCMKGTCVLVAKPHAVELYDLTEAQLLSFMKEAQHSARVLKQVTGAVKINYEIHGNTVPHLHMHLFPRTLDDPFPGGSIGYGQVDPPVYAPGEFPAFVRSMREAVDQCFP
jgi:diadenosine tetraphosphate (Ap4A) HIT family hydrolase